MKKIAFLSVLGLSFFGGVGASDSDLENHKEGNNERRIVLYDSSDNHKFNENEVN